MISIQGCLPISTTKFQQFKCGQHQTATKKKEKFIKLYGYM